MEIQYLLLELGVREFDVVRGLRRWKVDELDLAGIPDGSPHPGFRWVGVLPMSRFRRIPLARVVLNEEVLFGFEPTNFISSAPRYAAVLELYNTPFVGAAFGDGEPVVGWSILKDEWLWKHVAWAVALEGPRTWEWENLRLPKVHRPFPIPTRNEVEEEYTRYDLSPFSPRILDAIGILDGARRERILSVGGDPQRASGVAFPEGGAARVVDRLPNGADPAEVALEFLGGAPIRPLTVVTEGDPRLPLSSAYGLATLIALSESRE